MPLPGVVDLCPALDVRVDGVGGRVWYARGAEGRAAVELVEAGGERRWLHRRARREGWIQVGDGIAVFGKRVRLGDLGAVLRATLRMGGLRVAFKGALHEAERTLRAERGVARVARLYAVGERRRAGWVVEETLLFEALLEHETLGQRMAACGGDRAQRRAALERAAEVVLDFDRARLAHLDLNPGNVMLHASDPRQDCAVDIEQVVDLDRPRPDLLAHGFGHLYSRGIQEHVSREEYHAVALPALARGLGMALGDVPADVLQAYSWFVGRSLARRVRLRLARRGLERMAGMRARIAQRSPFVVPAGVSSS